MLARVKKILNKIVVDESGDLLEELMVLPVKIMLFVMFFEFSLLLGNYFVFIESYGTCLRLAEIRGGVDSVVEDSVRSQLESMPNSIDIDNVVITGTPATVPSGGLIEVEMEYPYEYFLVSKTLSRINKTVTFHPKGFTTSSKVVR